MAAITEYLTERAPPVRALILSKFSVSSVRMRRVAEPVLAYLRAFHLIAGINGRVRRRSSPNCYLETPSIRLARVLLRQDAQ
jgi:hypothetical protein